MRLRVITCIIAAATLFSAISVTFVDVAFAQKAAKKSDKKESQDQFRRYKVQNKDRTNVDFDDALIDGKAKNPFGTLLNARDQEFNRGFINIRKQWHDHMILSVSGMAQ